MKKEGLTRSIGVSNYQMIHLQYLATQANEMPVVDQIELHPLLTQKPLLEFNRQHQIVTQAWSPLGRGAVLNEPVLKDIAAAHNNPPRKLYCGGISRMVFLLFPSQFMKSELPKTLIFTILNLTPKKWHR